MKKTLTVLAASALLSTAAFGVEATTDPVGGSSITLQGDSKFNFIAVPFVDAVAYQSAITGDTATTLTVSGATWTTNEFSGTHFVEIASGTAEGLMVDIASNTADTLTLGDDISGYGLAGTETIKIRPHATLSGIFGATNSAGLTGGATAGASDEVQLWNPSTQSFTNYFYNTIQSQWKLSTDPFGADQGATVVYPDQGIVIMRRGAGTHDITLTGSVKTGMNKGVLATGFNFYNSIRPVDTTLGATGWESDLTGGATAGASDEIGVWDPSTQSLTNYFYNSIQSQWKLSTDPFGADQGSVSIPAGASILINRKGASTTLDEAALTIN